MSIRAGIPIAGQRSTGNVVVAGALATILVWLWHEVTDRAVPTDVAMALQTVLLAYISHKTVN